VSQLPYAYDERLTDNSAASSTYADVASPIIAAADLTPGRKYLILARAEIHRYAIVTSAGGIRMCHGSGATTFGGSEVLYSQLGSSSPTTNGWYFYMTVWTAVAGEDVKIQIKGDGSNALGYRWASLVAIPLGSDLGLTENVDWFYAEDPTDIVLTGTLQDGAQITFTPGVAAQDWLILALSNIDSDTTATDMYLSRLAESGGATANWDVQVAGRNANNKYMLPHMQIVTLGAVSQTFKEQSRRVGATAATAQRFHSAVFAIRLNAFDARSWGSTDAKVDVTDATVFGTLVGTTGATQVVNNGAALVLGYFVYEATPTQVSLGWVYGRTQLDNVDEFSTDGVTSDYTAAAYRCYYPAANVTGQMVPYLHMSVIPSVPAGAHTLDVDASTGAAAAGRGVKFRRLLYLSLDVVPPSGPSVVSASPRKNEQIMYQNDYSPNRRRVILGPLVDATDGITPETGEVGGVPQFSKNGAAYGSAPALAALDNTKGTYYSQLTQAQLSDLGSLTVRYKSAATAEFGPITLAVEELPWLWDGPLTGATANTFTLGTGDVAPPTSIPAGSIVRVVAGTGAGQSALVSSYSNPVGTLEPNVTWSPTPDSTSRVVIVPGLPPVVPDVNVKLVDGDAAAATGLKEGAGAIRTFLIVAGTNTPTVITTDLPTTVGGSATLTDLYKGRGIIGKTGQSDGDEAEILAAAIVSSKVQLTVATLAAAPVVGTKFVMT
jgi:hypothetical protein